MTTALDRKHQPGQHRQDDHAGVGAGRNPLDKLNLAGRIQLDEGEELVSSGKLDFDDARVRVAVTRRNGSPSMRLAVVAYGDMPKWSGNQSKTADLEAERGRIMAEQGQVDEDSERWDQLQDQLIALGEGDDWDTARLDESAIDQLRTTLRAAADEGKRIEKEVNAAWAEVQRLEAERDKLRGMTRKWTDEEDALWDSLTEQIAAEEAAAEAVAPFTGDRGYTVISEGEIPGDWGTVEYEVYFDDLVARATLAVRPAGAPADWDASIDRAVFDMAELRKIVRLLDAGEGKTAIGHGRRLRPGSLKRDYVRDDEGQFARVPGAGLASALADILDDVNFESLDPNRPVYVGIREDGLMDLGIGLSKDDPVGRFSYRDTEAITDAAYELWRERTNNGEDSNGVIDDRFIQTDHDEIYLAISEKQTYTADPDDPDDEDLFEPVLTVGIPTPDNTAENADFHEVDLDEAGFDAFVEALRSLGEYEPAEVDSEGISGADQDIALLADHTIRVADDGDWQNAQAIPVEHALALAATIRELLKQTPEPGNPDDPDVVDSDDITDSVGVSLWDDGTFTLNIATGDIEMSRESMEDLADVLDRYAGLDRARLGGRSGKAGRGGGMRTKQFSRVEIKDADRGEVSAIIATLDEVDSDGDAYEFGAFNDAEMAISPWGHKVWDGGLPVGSGRIDEVNNEAIFTGRFFLNTTDGLDHFNTLKALYDHGINVEWSYGYDVLDEGPGGVTRKGKTARRVIRKLAVHEVSPLLKGAGVRTRTLSAKSAGPSGRSRVGGAVVLYKSAIRPHKADTYTDAWDAAAAVAGVSADASVSDLRSMFAWVDSGQDPEAKGSYKFPHHSTVNGPASIRACVAGIAVLNGGRGGTTIPESDRKGVWEHLAAHLRDADREPPELRTGSSGAKSLNDVLAETLVTVSTALDVAARWAEGRRAVKGKGLTNINAEMLDWLGDELTRLRTIVDSPEDDILREFAKFVAREHQLRITP